MGAQLSWKDPEEHLRHQQKDLVFFKGNTRVVPGLQILGLGDCQVPKLFEECLCHEGQDIIPDPA